MIGQSEWLGRFRGLCLSRSLWRVLSSGSGRVVRHVELLSRCDFSHIFMRASSLCHYSLPRIFNSVSIVHSESGIRFVL